MLVHVHQPFISSNLLVFPLSECNGAGVNLLKAGTKRRRTKTEITNEKEEARIKEVAIQEKMAQFDQMQQRMNQLEAQCQEGEQLKGFFGDMINKGKLVREKDGTIDVAPSFNKHQNRKESPMKH